MPAFHKGPSSIDPLELAKALLGMVKPESIYIYFWIRSDNIFLISSKKEKEQPKAGGRDNTRQQPTKAALSNNLYS